MNKFLFNTAYSDGISQEEVYSLTLSSQFALVKKGMDPDMCSQCEYAALEIWAENSMFLDNHKNN